MAVPAQQQKTDSAKYDRQLRLWGEEGQALLEGARICLLNASATGCEILKNLVLPGIGHITIVDAHKVTAADFNNFFIVDGSIGKSRAAVTCENLLELNALVHGDFLEEDPVNLIEKQIDYFKKFTLVISEFLPLDSLLKLSKYLYSHDIPLVVAHSFGLIGYLRVVVPQHLVVQSKPDHPLDDLRIANPWPELLQYAESIVWDKLDSLQHSHVPYPLILVTQLRKWMAANGGQPPKTSDQKKAYKHDILKAKFKVEEENFDEAYNNAHKYLVPAEIPSTIKSILEDAHCQHLNEHSKPFWILAAALREFVNENKCLPLIGSIPDMASTTEGYLTLQKLYQDKAAKDVETIKSKVEAILKKLNRPSGSISDEEVKKFCKNSYFLHCINYRSLEQEWTASTVKGSLITSELANGAFMPNNMPWYVALRAVFEYHRKHGKFPGASKESVEVLAKEATEVQQIATDFLKVCGHTGDFEDSYAKELCRFGNSELHAVAGMMGGIGSQEVIKLITHQYLPMDNTMILNGIISTTNVYNL